MIYKTIIALHAWANVTNFDGTQTQTYCDPEDEGAIYRWNVHLQHRDPETDDLCDPEKAPDLDLDFENYATAYLVADALACKMGWELRQY